LLALLQREVKTGEQVVEFLDRWAASKREKGHDTAIKAVAGLDKIVREDWDKVMGGGKAPAPRTTAYDGRSSEYKASRAAYWAEQERREALWQPRTKEAIEAAKEVKDG
jgi:hypothetical protein